MVDYIKLAMNGWKLNELRELKQMNEDAMNGTGGTNGTDSTGGTNGTDDTGGTNGTDGTGGTNGTDDTGGTNGNIDINAILDEKRKEINELKKQISEMQIENLHRNNGANSNNVDVLMETIKKIL